MAKVQLAPWWWAAAGIALLPLVQLMTPLSSVGWLAGGVYLLTSSLLVSLGLARRGAQRFGPANAVTATRSMLAGIVIALIATSLSQPISVPLLIGLAAPALALDAVDGLVARRTRSESALGARFDMEVDAILMLALSVYDIRVVGWWVLAIGLMRYAFVAVGWLLPWMRGQLPFRYWRKVVAAACGIALAVVAAGILPPPVAVAVTALALILLLESFGRDVVWLIYPVGDPSPPSAMTGDKEYQRQGTQQNAREDDQYRR